MKWVIWILAGLVAVLAIGGFVFRDMIAFMMFRASVKPPAAFAETTPPAAPDYANPDHWAALPDRADNADYTPEGVADGQAGAPADVFFIHPTTYIEGSGWNAPMGHEAADEFVDDFVMTGQASAFNGAARIFAPRYRQAQIYAFFALEDGGEEALELAYADVEAAFDHYLQHHNQGRPFIIAGHSQGGLHARTLLERRVSGTALKERLVAAYPIGYFIERDEMAAAMPDIPVCGAAGETGCLVTWNATGDGYRSFQPLENMVCVNPLTWTADDTQGGFEANLGALDQAEDGLIEGAADARCDGGKLHVSEIRTDAYDDQPVNMGRGNHHLLDYALYWSNLRANAAERVAAFQAE
ncbi:MAG: DUF3089 domain-containing protein [Pseudomonadota bacterium]